MSPLNRLFFHHSQSPVGLRVVVCILLFSTRTFAEDDWQRRVRTAADQHQLSAALAIVDRRLAEAPSDMDAHAWRGRLLAWTGHWPEAEAEYHLVLLKFPQDVDVHIGLADVLLWQKKYSEALAVLEDARSDPANSKNREILVRRARVLSLLQRASEARAQFHDVLAFDPGNREARSGLMDLASASRYELLVSQETDFFNYTENAQVESVILSAHWNQRWITTFGVSPYYLFGERAVKVWSDAAYRFRKNNWVRVLGEVANPQDVVPERAATIEYGHAFRFSNPGSSQSSSISWFRGWFDGLESSYQESSLWYRGARVVTVNTTQVLYLPREWTWTLSVTGARTQFIEGPPDWVPSGSTKVGIPLSRNLSGSAMFAVGAENFAQVDQIGRLSARTYGGGLRYRFAENQEMTGFIGQQNRDHGQKQTSLGLSYGIRF